LGGSKQAVVVLVHASRVGHHLHIGVGFREERERLRESVRVVEGLTFSLSSGKQILRRER